MVKMNRKEVKFPRSEDGLHFCKFPKTHEPNIEAKNNMPAGPVLLSMAEENMEGFLENQVQCAKEAKKLCHKVGVPTCTNFR